MKSRIWCVLAFVGLLVLVAGCTLTEEKAQDIAQTAGEVAGTAARIGLPAVGMSPEAAAGVASSIAAAVGAVALLIIKSVSKKEIARVADTTPTNGKKK